MDKPKNTAVFSGADVYLSCSSNSTTNIAWYNDTCVIYNNCGTSFSQFTVYDGSMVMILDPRYQVMSDDSGGLHSRTLVIRSAHLSDSGMYICQDDIFHSSSAKLIVIGEQKN